MKKSVKLNFCTLFDSYYLSKGLALYYSLEETCQDFHLYIFAFDDKSYNYLVFLNLKKATIISLNQFEDEELLKVKPHRTIAEYCWTSTSSTILYCLENFKIESCTYLDADLYFFQSPDVIFKEIGDSSIALTKHNYHFLYDQSKSNGIYCVQFMFFRNNKTGIEALKWWRSKCIGWCFNYLENGKFGDQGYLPELVETFKDTKIIENEGAGMAPWNTLKYGLIDKNTFFIKKSRKSFNLNFYHFHYLHYHIEQTQIIANPGKVFFSKRIINEIYIPYIKSLYDYEYAFLNQSFPTLKESIIKIENYSVIEKLIVILKVTLKKISLIRNFLNGKKKSSF
jgi:hypothetical protein